MEGFGQQGITTCSVVGRRVTSKKDSSEFSTSWWKLKTALYGSTTVSETFGDGITEKVSMMRSGYLGGGPNLCFGLGVLASSAEDIALSAHWVSNFKAQVGNARLKSETL